MFVYGYNTLLNALVQIAMPSVSMHIHIKSFRRLPLYERKILIKSIFQITYNLFNSATSYLEHKLNSCFG